MLAGGGVVGCGVGVVVVGGGVLCCGVDEEGCGCCAGGDCGWVGTDDGGRVTVCSDCVVCGVGEVG